MLFRKRGRVTAVVAAAVVLALGATGVAYAMGGFANDVIRGCYKLSDGGLRIGTNCTSKEKALTWNVQGPQGDTGARGPKGDDGQDGQRGPKGNDGAKGDKGNTGATGATGDKGDKGDKGDPGATGATGATGDKGDKGDSGTAGGVTGSETAVATTSISKIAGSSTHVLSADSPSCPAGKIVVGGGASTEYAQSLPGPMLSASFPQGSHWHAQVEPPDFNTTFTDDVSITVYVICVTGT
jgi:Collagen triple helix repeat (20 copies)